MPPPLADIAQDVVAGFAYRLTLSVQIDGPGDKHPALVCFAFLDDAGAVLAAPPEAQGTRFLTSDIFGDYLYIGRPAKAGLVDVDIVFVPPPGCTRVALALHQWRAQTVRVRQAMRLTPADPQTAEAIADIEIADKLIVSCDHDVVAGESYDVQFAFSGQTPLEDRGILMAVRFFCADGARIAPPDNLPVSGLAGAFRYVSPAQAPMTGLASVAAPAGAVRMHLRILRWKQTADWGVDEVRLVWLGGPDKVVAQGWLDLPTEEGPVAVHARITALGGMGTLLGAVHLLFEDAAGQPLLAQADNMSRSDRFMNHVPLRPPSRHMMAQDGSFAIARHFTPPAGAVRLGWRLLDPEGEWQLDMRQTPIVEPFSPQPKGQMAALPAAALWCDPALEASVAGALQEAVPVSALWEGTALGQVDLLGAALSAVRSGDWVALCAVLDGVPPQVLICPQYFDAEHRLLPDAVGPGCARVGLLPPARDVPLPVGEWGADACPLRSCFQVPQGAAYGVFALVAVGTQTVPALSGLCMVQVAPDTVCDGFDVATMSVSHLRAAQQLADLTDQIVLAQAVRRALAVQAPPDQKTDATSADQVSKPLGAGWLPVVGRAVPPQVAKVGRPLYLVAQEVEETARALLEALVRSGQMPALWRAPAYRTAGLPRAGEGVSRDTPRDGVHGTEHEGLHILQTVAAGFDRAGIGAADRLTFDAAYVQAAMRLHGAGLLHVSGGMDEMLVARAVAQAQGVPLVCEVVELVQAADGTLARLRHARLLECLRAADAVLAPLALHEGLCAQGVSAGAVVVLDAQDPVQSHIAAHDHARSRHDAPQEEET